MKRAGSNIFIFLFFLFLGGCAHLPERERLPTVAVIPTRIAVVATGESESVEKLLDLAEVALSSQAGINLLDRDNLRSVMLEQEMTASGLCSPDQIVRLGRLLRVDLFAVVQPDPSMQEPIGFFLFDSKRGVRLWDQGFAARKLEEQVDEFLKGIEIGLRKYQAPQNTISTICLGSVRNVDMPRSHDPLARSVAYVLQRQLVQGNSVTVLERGQLSRISEEYRLTLGKKNEELLSSLIIMDLEMSRGDEEDTITVSVNLSRNDGQRIGHVSLQGSAGELDKLCDALYRSICEVLKAEPFVKEAKTSHEASRFRLEASFLYGHGRIAEALERADAAYALDPEFKPFHSELLSYLSHHSYYMLKTNSAVAVAEAERTVDLMIDVRRQRGNWRKGVYYISKVMNMLSRPEYQRQLRDDLRLQSRQVRARYLRFRGIYRGSRDSRLNREYVRVIALCSEDVNQFCSLLDIAVGNWLNHDMKEASEKWGAPDLKGFLTREIQSMWNRFLRHKVEQDFPTFCERLVRLYEGMNEHPDPVVRLIAEQGVLYCSKGAKKLTGRELIEAVDVYSQKAYKTIADLEAQGTNWRQVHAYWVTMDTYDLVPDPMRRIDLYHKLFDYMLSRKEVVGVLAEAATMNKVATFWGYEYPKERVDVLPDKYYPRLVNNLERLLALMSSESARYPDPKYVRKNRLEKRYEDYRARVENMSKLPISQGDKLLISADAVGVRDLVHPIVSGNALFVLGAYNYYTKRDQSVYLFRVGLDDRSIQKIAHFKIPWRARFRSNGKVRWYSLNMFEDALLHGNTMYVATSCAGVYTIQLDTGLVKTISMENGLPSNYIHSLQVVSNRLYMGCGTPDRDAYLVEHNLGTGKSSVIASSQRKEKRTPWDNINPPYFIRKMVHDPNKSRLIMLVDYGAQVDNIHDYLPLHGVWSYNYEDGKFRHLYRVNRFSRWTAVVEGSKLIFSPWTYNATHPKPHYGPWFGAVEYDFKTAEARVVYSVSKKPAGPTLPVTELTLRAAKVRGPYLFHDGWMYFMDDSLGRISTSTGERQFFPQYHLHSARMDIWGSLQYLPDRESILAADNKRIWLINDDNLKANGSP